jgi:SAM-dependent methyltransferase
MGASLTEHTVNRGHVICDYEGTSYRTRFWDGQGREYEDLAERIALRRLLPSQGRCLAEVGAGFGRLADLYSGYSQVILLDYAQSGLREAQELLGRADRFLYVAANLYHLPLVPGICDTIVTVRVLHHLVDVPTALREIAAALRPGGTYVLEYANKRNVKAIARYVLRRQRWSPFATEPYEFADLNYDFHPTWMDKELSRAGFTVDAGLAVSHFRHPLLKRMVSPDALAAADGMFQRVGAVWKLSPSVFLRGRTAGSGSVVPGPAFCCPACRDRDLMRAPRGLVCGACGREWPVTDGIYDFRWPRSEE